MISGQMDLIHIIRNASLMVQFVLLLLLFFSVTSWPSFLLSIVTSKGLAKSPHFFTDFFWKSRDLSAAFTKRETASGQSLARLFRVGYVELKKMTQSGFRTYLRLLPLLRGKTYVKIIHSPEPTKSNGHWAEP
jgi:biopolymer transport protein TolQ